MALLMTRRLLLAGVLALGLGLGFLPATPRGAELASRLGDQEFWQIVTDSSEPNGYFRSDTLTSNELGFQRVIPELMGRTLPGRAYLGVGPEQNFTYMAALRPAVAIIFDIRRGNMLVQLMYKALFEMAKDRADFVSMLFSEAPARGARARVHRGGPLYRLRRIRGGRDDVPAEPQRHQGAPDQNAWPRALGQRSGRDRVRLRRVLPQRLRGPSFADLRGPDDAD